MFDKAFKRVNTSEDFRTELVQRQDKEKRVGEELTQESAKKQKVDDDKQTTELKKLMEIFPNEEEVAINAIPLAVKSPKIVDWKIYKEGKKSYYQIIRADGKSKMYLVFNQMLKEFEREYLKDLYNLLLMKKLDDFREENQVSRRIVRIKSHLNVVGITATHIDVNTALMELVLLVNFKDNILSGYYCWYKRNYLGTNLLAFGMDGNNQIILLAIGVSQGETGKSWTWFLSKLKEQIGEPPNLCILSDRHAAIIQGHRPKVVRKLEEAGFEKWSRAYCPRIRYNYMTSNSVESINSLTRIVRRVPITMLMKYFRDLLQRWYSEKRHRYEEAPENEFCDWAAIKPNQRSKSVRTNSLIRTPTREEHLSEEARLDEKRLRNGHGYAVSSLMDTAYW
uniref:Transposase, MuDR, MULE transposase domain protein n=1 Tax=Tanacetum cinerariifolium TaxID=118510 RepID=A0A6L2JB94_TANCI|nr:transposase, MuDR, MULE transposase domain protein [Tanacetum cinerariifolium]